MAKLLLTNGTGLAQQFSLGSGVSRVGRNSDNDIHLEHPSVSGFHCEITAAGDLFTIKDLGSTNGTFIDGRPIQQASLAHGQRLQLGQVELLLEAAGAEQTASVPFPMPASQGPAQPRLSVRLSQAAASAVEIA